MNTFGVFSSSPRRLIGLLLVLVVLLTACGGVKGDSWAGVSSDDEYIFVSHNERVVALNPASGAVKWEYPKDKNGKFFALPVVDNGTVFIGDYEGKLHAINRETGEARWVYEPDQGTIIGPISTEPKDRVISGAAVDAERVYFGLGSRNIVAVSRETAEKVWTFETDHGVWGTPLLIPVSDGQNDQDVLYVASLDHFFYAINPVTGKQLWRKSLGGAAPGNIVYDAKRNRVYIGTFVSELLALDLDSHEIVARYETDNWLWSGPALEDDMLYFGDLTGNLYAVKVTDDGFVQDWKRDVADDAIRATPLVFDDLIIVGSKDKHVYAVSKEDGSEVWNAKTDGEVLSEIVLVSDELEDDEGSYNLVVVGTSEGDELVLALKSTSGSEGWHYSD
ncbi:MAG: PQQ-binding-like beta-propeller repeat protein [Anaerolineae bacterium]|nr:PQQ-binding-like beta-propeller repeat protein [Anaerolineae bacterium]